MNWSLNGVYPVRAFFDAKGGTVWTNHLHGGSISGQSVRTISGIHDRSIWNATRSVQIDRRKNMDNNENLYQSCRWIFHREYDKKTKIAALNGTESSFIKTVDPELLFRYKDLLQPCQGLYCQLPLFWYKKSRCPTRVFLFL